MQLHFARFLRQAVFFFLVTIFSTVKSCNALTTLSGPLFMVGFVVQQFVCFH